jgi:glycosyltransferase involved in cell wall biosynthesis
LNTPLRVALLSPYHGGSHASWAEGLAEHSRHDLQLLALPDRYWKWRMRGAAITLARRYAELPPADVILATDMLDVTTFLALTRTPRPAPPLVLYMHENQFTYPLPKDPRHCRPRNQPGNEQFAFINLVSMLAADRVVFNSAFHRDELLASLPEFLEATPDHHELDCVGQVRERSEVMYAGIRVDDLGDAGGIDGGATERSAAPDGAPPLVVWNHRWEYDKNPAAFFAALRSVAAQGVGFRVALCGECPGGVPSVFEAGMRELGDRVVHAGFLPRDEYAALLRRAAVVVSTAGHEFYGISVLEAIAAGAIPLLPRRLSYPEVLPERAGPQCLYEDSDELELKLANVLRDPAGWRAATEGLAAEVARRHGWNQLAPAYDALLGEAVVRGSRDASASGSEPGPEAPGQGKSSSTSARS